MRYFDLHCDTVTHANNSGLNMDAPELAASLSHRREMKDAASYIQVHAIFVPDRCRGRAAVDYYEDNLAYYRRQAEKFPQLYPIACKGQLKAAAEGTAGQPAGGQELCGSILAVEGGAVLAGDPDRLETLWRDGVRLITITWNGENELACGISDQEKGLTPVGRQVIDRMSRMGMGIDLSHISDKSFYEVVERADGPLLASHSCSRGLCGHPRNLTDDQFRILVEKKAVVGLNFYSKFLNDDGDRASLEDAVRHVFRFLELGGEDVLSMGSDFDGAHIPQEFDDLTKVGRLYSALLRHGCPQTTADKIFFDNAYRFFYNLMPA